jgi:hypothetical protein
LSRELGSTHFLTRGLDHVSTEMSLHVLAYNLKQLMSVIGITRTMKAMHLMGGVSPSYAQQRLIGVPISGRIA